MYSKSRLRGVYVLKILRHLCLLAVMCMLVPSRAACGGDILEDRHVIDWHVHVAGLGYGDSGIFVSRSMRDNYRFGFLMKWMNVDEAELRSEGDQIIVRKLSESLAQSRYVDQAVVLAMDGIVDRQTGKLDRINTPFYVPNEYVAAETAKYPNLLFGASINPNRPDSIGRLEEAATRGAVLVKWIPSIMDIDPSDEYFIPFYKKMAELNLPLLSHTGREKSFPNARDELADPLKLALPLQQGVTVIAAHISTTGASSGQDNFERILPMFAEFPNLYTEISSLTQINKLGYLAKALDVPGLPARMLYGTDWPLQHFPLISPWYHVRHIGIRNAWRIGTIDNLWDRDVSLKRAFGVPDTVFTRVTGRITRPATR